MTISYESFKIHEIFFQILFRGGGHSYGTLQSNSWLESNLRASKIHFWKCSIHRNRLPMLPQQALLMACMAEVFWRPTSGLIDRCHRSFQRHGILDAVPSYDKCTRILDVHVYFSERVSSKLKQPDAMGKICQWKNCFQSSGHTCALQDLFVH